MKKESTDQLETQQSKVKSIESTLKTKEEELDEVEEKLAKSKV